jgi:hypothetical protein
MRLKQIKKDKPKSSNHFNYYELMFNIKTPKKNGLSLDIKNNVFKEIKLTFLDYYIE